MTHVSSESTAWRSRQLRTLLTLGCAVTVLVADQITKTLAVDHLSRGPVHLVGPFSFALAYNTGIAFSLGSGLTLPIILVVMVVVVMVFWLSRGVPSVPMSIALGLILGGASGNLADRLFRNHGGAVVDFIATRVWPTFNVADACIVVGAALLGIVYWREGAGSRSMPDSESGAT